MGTYIPFYFVPSCGQVKCKGGWDCHPDRTYPEVEAMAAKLRLPECCHWSIHSAYQDLCLNTDATPKQACKYGADCYRMNPVHLFHYSHREREKYFDNDSKDI